MKERLSRTRRSFIAYPSSLEPNRTSIHVGVHMQLVPSILIAATLLTTIAFTFDCIPSK